MTPLVVVAPAILQDGGPPKASSEQAVRQGCHGDSNLTLDYRPAVCLPGGLALALVVNVFHAVGLMRSKALFLKPSVLPFSNRWSIIVWKCFS